jgi:hypothetical protein
VANFPILICCCDSLDNLVGSTAKLSVWPSSTRSSVMYKKCVVVVAVQSQRRFAFAGGQVVKLVREELGTRHNILNAAK